jgi:2,3-bisphosphoglycerate-independent phosphoglycerate mutase
MVSSKKTEHYDELPEMSAVEVAESVIEAIASKNYDFIAVNFANPDMVGHTGNLEAAIQAIETVDRNVGHVLKTSQECGYTTIVTSDHGNADQMMNTTTNVPHTAHSANDVPFILIPEPTLSASYKKSIQLRSGGLLGNIAPTILNLMDLQIPPEMTCKSLLK